MMNRILFCSFQKKHSPTDALALDFWPPELSENQLVLFEAISLWNFVTVLVGNEYTCSSVNLNDNLDAPSAQRG